QRRAEHDPAAGRRDARRALAPAQPLPREPEQREQDERDPVLLHHERRSEQKAAREQRRRPPRVDRPEEQERPGDRRQEDEVRGGREGAQTPRAEGRDREQAARGGRRDVVEQPAPEDEQENRRRQIHQQQAKVDPPGRLAEDRQDRSVRRVRPRQLHVVDQTVRRDALQDQLPGIGVLALLALERHVEQTDADGADDEKRQDEGQERGAHSTQAGTRGSMSALIVLRLVTSSSARPASATA